MIPVVISGLKSKNNYNLDYVINYLLLNKFNTINISDNTEVLKIKIRLENIDINSLYSLFYYTSETILYFFELTYSDSNVITNKEEQKLITFITLFSILLELYFTNHQQLSNLNINTLKQLINNINSNLNNKIINNKDIINLVFLLSNTNYKCRTEILKYFNLDLTERIKQLNELNLKDLKSKNNNEKIDKSVLAKIKSTLSTFISTSALTLVTIKALVNMIALIVEKIPMLSSMINKGSSMISNGINIINDIGNGSINTLFNSSSKTKQTKTNISEINPGSKHTITNNNKGTIKGFNSKSKNKNNSIKNRNTNNQLGNNNNTSDNPNLGKNTIPNGGGSITITPNGSKGKIGNTNNPLIQPGSNNNKQNSDNKFANTDIAEPKSKTGILNNPVNIDDDKKIKDNSTVDNLENGKIQRNGEVDDYDDAINDIDLDDNFSGFSINNKDNKKFSIEQNLTNSQSQSPLQDIPQNSSKNNPTLNQTAIGRSNTDNIDSETNSNKNYDNNLSNNNSQNILIQHHFKTNLKKKTKIMNL